MRRRRQSDENEGSNKRCKEPVAVWPTERCRESPCRDCSGCLRKKADVRPCAFIHNRRVDAPSVTVRLQEGYRSPPLL